MSRFLQYQIYVQLKWLVIFKKMVDNFFLINLKALGENKRICSQMKEKD
jgi:hypothetical protein